MIVDLFFNELSLTPAEAGPSGSSSEFRLPIFTQLIARCFDDLKTSRCLHSSVNLWGVDLGGGETLSTWVNHTGREERLFWMSLQTKSPLLQVDDIAALEKFTNADTKYADELGLGIRAAWAMDGLALSLATSERWDRDTLPLKVEQLNEAAELVTSDEVVRHASAENHLNIHRSWAIERRLRAPHGLAYLENIKEIAPNLLFCPEAEEQLRRFFAPNASELVKWQRVRALLSRLNAAAKGWTDGEFGWRDAFPSASGESESVRNNESLRKLREFTLNGEKEYFDLHLKMAGDNWRIYFRPDECPGTVHIGYIGPHF